MADWISAYLAAGGYPNTKKNRTFLESWQRWEGGATKNDASFNYLNTTQDMGGSPSINRFGVRAYRDLEQGASAFAQTLKNGRYGGLDAALAAGDPYTKKSVDGLSIWLSGKVNPSGIAYASRILGTHEAPDREPESYSSVTTRAPAGPTLPRQGFASIFSDIATGAQTPTEAFRGVADSMRQQSVPQAALSLPVDAEAPSANTSKDVLKYVQLAKGADRTGVATKPAVLDFVGALGEELGKPLEITTGSNHKRITQDGYVSDHWSGDAADVPASGASLMRLGYLALVQAGMDPKAAKAAAAKGGGLFNVGGYQIIFGNYPGHSNHLHVGVRR